MTAAEERRLAKAIETGDFKSVGIGDARRRELRRAARQKLEGSRTRISLRVLSEDLAKLRAIAHGRGIPYQTLINAIIHQYAKGDLSDKF
jgi:predicted DNA binding CopG/RHH family protein